MFVQIIQGRVKDAAGLKKSADLWDQNLKPGSIGYLGSTGGVTEDGEFFIAARFESEEAAQKNSDRPEQGEWYNEMIQNIEGEPTFTNYTEVETFLDGGSDDAGFVQAMQGKVSDIERARALDEQFSSSAREHRPDLIGGFQCSQPDGSFTTVNYFTSEAEARAAEKQEPPEEFKNAMAEWGSLMQGEMKFVDLKDPWYYSK
jgi:hypothetical protein